MTSHRTDLAFNSLQSAFLTAFRWTVERDRMGEIADFATAWVDLVASGLDEVRLTATPAIDPQSPPLPFLETHRIHTETFIAARSGMRGGPTIDVLLQVWFDTEEMACSFGIPLVFRKIAHSGRMPDLVWAELQETCRKLALATPCARLVFVAKDRDFDWWGASSYWHPNPIIASGAQGFAGTRLPPAPVNGRQLEAFCLDLASGWIGDPALSGMERSPVLDEVLSNFQINHVLRIHVQREGKDAIWHQPPLPL